MAKCALKKDKRIKSMNLRTKNFERKQLINKIRNHTAQNSELLQLATSNEDALRLSFKNVLTVSTV